MYSTNLWIFSFYLAFAPSLCFYFLFFICFFISVKPCLLTYSIILFSSCLASSLSEGEGIPRKLGRMLSLPLPGSVWRTKSSADRNCPWLVPDNGSAPVNARGSSASICYLSMLLHSLPFFLFCTSFPSGPFHFPIFYWCFFPYYYTFHFIWMCSARLVSFILYLTS